MEVKYHDRKQSYLLNKEAKWFGLDNYWWLVFLFGFNCFCCTNGLLYGGYDKRKVE